MNDMILYEILYMGVDCDYVIAVGNSWIDCDLIARIVHHVSPASNISCDEIIALEPVRCRGEAPEGILKRYGSALLHNCCQFDETLLKHGCNTYRFARPCRVARHSTSQSIHTSNARDFN